MSKHRAKGWFPDVLERMLTTDSGFLFNNGKKRSPHRVQWQVVRCGCIIRSLISKIHLLFHKKIGKYRTAWIKLQKLFYFEWCTRWSTRFQEAGTIETFVMIKTVRHRASTSAHLTNFSACTRPSPPVFTCGTQEVKLLHSSNTI